MEDKPRDLDKEIKQLQNGIARRKRIIKQIENEINQLEYEKKIQADYLNQQQEELTALRELKKEK